MSKCGYCEIPLELVGMMENQDDLGEYLAETWLCPICGYRLEKNPVYLDSDERKDFQVVE